MGILAVVVLHLPHAQLVLVAPDHLAAITGFFIHGNAFGDRAGQIAARLVAQVAVGVFLTPRRSGPHRQFAPHKRAGPIRRLMRLTRFKRVVEPLVVRTFPMRVNEQRRSLDIARLIEHKQALVAIVGGLREPYPELASALLPVLVGAAPWLLGVKLPKLPRERGNPGRFSVLFLGGRTSDEQVPR